MAPEKMRAAFDYRRRRYPAMQQSFYCTDILYDSLPSEVKNKMQISKYILSKSGLSDVVKC